MIIPIFIPNEGCPHRCIFCHQEKITAQNRRPIDGSLVKKTIDLALTSRKFDPVQGAEVAFYGGTFSRLSVEKMTELLTEVSPYIKQGVISSVRVSTRPDALDNKRIDLMGHLGVRTVELGVQSMDDQVLELSFRGHQAKDTIDSAHMLRRAGFRLGVQLMPGLPGDSKAKFTKSVDQVMALAPDVVRLYPTVVIRETGLARLYERGRYHPLSLDEAVDICAMACERFENKGISVIRMGLMASPGLTDGDQILAGPWHDSFGLLVRTKIHQGKIASDLPGKGAAKRIMLLVPRREVPLVRGFKNSGVRWIEARTGAQVMGVKPEDSIPSGRVQVHVLG